MFDVILAYKCVHLTEAATKEEEQSLMNNMEEGEEADEIEDWCGTVA